MDNNYWVARHKNLPGRIDRKEFMTTYHYKNGERIPEAVPGSVKEEAFDEEAFLGARKTASEKFNKFWDEFKQALFEYHGLENHPKKDKLIDYLRIEHGRDLEQIIYHAEEIADLMK